MAKQIKELLIDDIDGSEASKTVDFAIDGVSYQIDLSGSHDGELRGALAPFISAARRVPASPARRGRSHVSMSTRQSREKAAEIRAWAKKNKISVSTRGRIAANVVSQYEAANG